MRDEVRGGNWEGEGDRAIGELSLDTVIIKALWCFYRDPSTSAGVIVVNRMGDRDHQVSDDQGATLLEKPTIAVKSFT